MTLPLIILLLLAGCAGESHYNWDGVRGVYSAIQAQGHGRVKDFNGTTMK